MRGLRCSIQRALDLLGDRFELAVTVELIAKQVQHDGGLRLDLRDRARQARLVDLEHAPVGLELAVGARPVECRGGHAIDQVGPGPVRDHAMARALEQPADQPRGRRLAVGARDHDRALRQVLRQPGQDARIDRAGDVARQRGTATSTGDAAESTGGLARPDRDGFSDHSQEPDARVTAVQQSSFPMACLPSSSVLTRL